VIFSEKGCAIQFWPQLRQRARFADQIPKT
jgi:hypothetical protein